MYDSGYIDVRELKVGDTVGLVYDKWSYRQEPLRASVNVTAKVTKVYKDGSILLDNDWRFTKRGSPHGWKPNGRLVRPDYAEEHAATCRAELHREARAERLFCLAHHLRHRPHEFSPATHPDEMRELLDELFPKEPAHAPE